MDHEPGYIIIIIIFFPAPNGTKKSWRPWLETTASDPKPENENLPRKQEMIWIRVISHMPQPLFYTGCEHM